MCHAQFRGKTNCSVCSIAVVTGFALLLAWYGAAQQDFHKQRRIAAHFAQFRGKAVFAGRKLKLLFLDDSSVSNEDLRNVAQLDALEWLSLRGTQVTDEGIVPLVGMSSLRQIDLVGTLVTSVGIERLKMGNPNLVVLR